jgi:hypothetical protein
MTTYSVSRTIKARPEAVWALITDGTRYPEWNPAVLSLSGRIADGEQIELVSIVNPDRKFKLNVGSVEPPRSMVWWDGMPLGLFKGVRTFTVRPIGESACEFHMEEVYSGVLAPLITKSIPDMTESFEMFGDAVKAEAERSGG